MNPAVPDEVMIVMTSADMSDLQRQMNDLKEIVKEGFEELKQFIREIDNRVRKVENTHSTCQVDLAAKIEAVRLVSLKNEEKLKELDLEKDRHQERIQKLESTNNILKWILTILTAIITALSVAVGGAVIQMIQGAL